jgi:hypothetical protein
MEVFKLAFLSMSTVVRDRVLTIVKNAEKEGKLAEGLTIEEHEWLLEFDAQKEKLDTLHYSLLSNK